MTRTTMERTGERIPQSVEKTPVLDQPSQNLEHEAWEEKRLASHS